MNRPDGDEGFPWDDVVDVICIGANPGVLAYARLCAAEELDVVMADWPADLDAQTAEYLAAMAADLDDDPAEPDPAATSAAPTPARSGPRGTLEPFVGEELRRWSARCLASPSGVLSTQVPGVLALMRTDTGELVTAAEVPADPAPEDPSGVFAGLIIEDGRIAGAWLEEPGGRVSIRADSGLVFAVGRPAGDGPTGPGLALVSRRGGRFARLERLVVEDR